MDSRSRSRSKKLKKIRSRYVSGVEIYFKIINMDIYYNAIRRPKMSKFSFRSKRELPAKEELYSDIDLGFPRKK